MVGRAPKLRKGSGYPLQVLATLRAFRFYPSRSCFYGGHTIITFCFTNVLSNHYRQGVQNGLCSGLFWTTIISTFAQRVINETSYNRSS